MPLLSLAQVWWFVDGKAPADMDKHLDKSDFDIEANQQFTFTEKDGCFTYVSSCTPTITPRGRAVSNGDEVVSKPNDQADKGDECPAASSLHGPSPTSLVSTSEATRQHVNTPESASNSSVMPSGLCDNESQGGILGQVNQPEVPTRAKVETGIPALRLLQHSLLEPLLIRVLTSLQRKHFISAVEGSNHARAHYQ